MLYRIIYKEKLGVPTSMGRKVAIIEAVCAEVKPKTCILSKISYMSLYISEKKFNK